MFNRAPLAAALLAVLAFPHSSVGSSTVNNVHHTFYGYPDNSPPGPATAYDCGYGRGYTAGGLGSYADPLTFATAPGEFDKCEVVWDPYTRKYLVFQDTCAACTTDWKKGIRHIDLWLGSSTVNAHKVVKQCERDLTPNQGQPVVRKPATGLDADTRPLFANGICHTERVYPQ